jgi:hypothetical protein
MVFPIVLGGRARLGPRDVLPTNQAHGPDPNPRQALFTLRRVTNDAEEWAGPAVTSGRAAGRAFVVRLGEPDFGLNSRLGVGFGALSRPFPAATNSRLCGRHAGPVSSS